MGNVVLFSLIFGYVGYSLWKLIKKRGACCEDCDCPIKAKQK